MSEYRDTAAAWRADGRFGFLKGRSGRKEYWICLGAVIGLGALLNGVLPGKGHVPIETLVLFLQIRRFHDFGRTGWWAVMGHALPALEILAVITFGGNTPEAQGLGLGVATLLALVFAAWLGSIPGDAHENRFGPVTNGRNLRDVFS